MYPKMKGRRGCQWATAVVSGVSVRTDTALVEF